MNFSKNAFAQLSFAQPVYQLRIRSFTSGNHDFKISDDAECPYYVSGPQEYPMGAFLVDFSRVDIKKLQEVLSTVGESFKGDVQEFLTATKSELTTHFPNRVSSQILFIEIENRVRVEEGRELSDIREIFIKISKQAEELHKNLMRILEDYVDIKQAKPLQEDPVDSLQAMFLPYKEADTRTLNFDPFSGWHMLPTCDANSARRVNCYLVFNSLKDLLSYDTFNLYFKDLPIKKCENCGGYFVANRKDAIFCQEVSPLPGDKGKACNEIAPQKRAQIKRYEQAAEKKIKTYLDTIKADITAEQAKGMEADQEKIRLLEVDRDTFNSEVNKLRKLIGQGRITIENINVFFDNERWRDDKWLSLLTETESTT